MRYPTRTYQPDTTVVSNDRRRYHQASQTKAAPAPTGAAFTYPLDKPPAYQVLKFRCTISRRTRDELQICRFRETHTCQAAIDRLDPLG
jgi:hypothetical protein